MFKVKVNLNLDSISKKFWYPVPNNNEKTTILNLLEFISSNFGLNEDLLSICSVELEEFELLRDVALNQILKEGDQLVVKQSAHSTTNQSQLFNFQNFSTMLPNRINSSFITAEGDKNKTLPLNFKGRSGDELVKQLLPNSKLLLSDKLTKAQRINLKKRIKQKILKEESSNSKKPRLNPEISHISLNNNDGTLDKKSKLNPDISHISLNNNDNSLEFYANLVNEDCESVSNSTLVKAKKDKKDKKEKKDKSKKSSKAKSLTSNNESIDIANDQTQISVANSITSSVKKIKEKGSHKENSQVKEDTLLLSCFPDREFTNCESINGIDNSNSQTPHQNGKIESTNHDQSSSIIDPQQKEKTPKEQQLNSESNPTSADLDKLSTVNTADWTPTPSTRIAFKEWTLINGSPGLSEYKLGTIINFNSSTEEIAIRLDVDEKVQLEDELEETNEYDLNRRERQRIFNEEGIEVEYVNENEVEDQVIWKNNLIQLKVLN